MKSLIDISIIIPAKDEGENILPLADEITRAMDREEIAYEVIWVDDGSTDNTLALIKQLNDQDPGNRYISFAENAGQSAALMAGFHESRGKYIATLDADRQNDPADIPMLFKHIESGQVDMVNGFRQKRKDSFVRRMASKIANGARNLFTGKSVRDVGCSTRLFKREIFYVFPHFKGMHRFIPTFAQMRGFRISEVPVNHRPRTRGETKYSINNRLWVGIYDLFGVRWVRQRSFLYRISQSSPNQTRE